jgi:hypothetical protein
VGAGRLAIDVGVGVGVESTRVDVTAIADVLVEMVRRVDETAMADVLVISWVHVYVGYGAAWAKGTRKRRRAKKCMVGLMYLERYIE